ncbi:MULTISPECIES: hybrid sensor histidine kinase/response regulator [Vibrio]|uniref:hybrid sensor histidine kinase/response regulator n=1 Tax=Vibrio TaxID=662 RepID=UPI002076068B|nr:MULTISPECIES: hybrid sensor histidine kinase/response regulator [Vibrio]USD33427.1 response regulator [Vibrio sp. SCSIO 43186]USD46496.1 response regulator [Vibrio sp. SCSIO 43145]USD70551.1 response regulator [Vibrio sp. SCSIO 43139]USD95470.1 histidine kinase [Vibrio coralliilyticus]
MEIRSSLKRKSFLALAMYMAFVIAVIGTVSYLVVEPPVRDQLEKNLDLRTQIIAAEIKEPLNSSLGILQSVVSIGSTNEPQGHQAEMLYKLFSVIDGVAISGGLWPIPYSIDRGTAYKSLFFNRASDGQVDQVFSWDNPESGGYDKESWYTSVVNKPVGTVSWSEVYIDPFTHVQMITASSPYYIDDVFSGVATIDISLESLVSFVRKHAEEYELGVILKDSYGDVITEHNFQVVEDIYISSTDFGDFKWYIDVVNANRLVTEQVYDLVSKVEAGIIPIMLACVMMGYFLINRFLISPIVIIAKKVDDSIEGGIIDMTYNSQDEIKHLIDTFNQKTVFLEAEKQKAQASTKAKSAFLATLSHEIRTPMNGVLGTAQILLKTDLTEEQQKHMKTLYESGDHMMTLLNEILDFSKIEQGHLELENNPFPLEAIIGSINSVYFTLCSEKGLQFKVYSEVPHDRWYMSDKARLRQILFNLLNNAVKFTSRGYVEVYFKEIEKQGQNYLEIKVRDTGIGIAKEAQQKIFKPFEQAESSTTRRFGGTGLGLAIVKQLCNLMNGSVTLASELGIGTSFDVLVAMDHCEPRNQEIKEHSKLNYSGLKALIVEDNRTNAIIINTFMTNKGFECDVVENGELSIHAIASKEYDLVLMDNHMPVMDGVEATSAIRSLPSSKSKILILGCTADVFKETRERMLGVGVDYIVSKPIDENELDDALYQYSERLYQYKPMLLSGSNIETEETESVLLTFYMSLENGDLEEAQEHFQALKAVTTGIEDQHLEETLKAIQMKLTLGEVPSQSDLDVLTVLLKDFCK